MRKPQTNANVARGQEKKVALSGLAITITFDPNSRCLWSAIDTIMLLLTDAKLICPIDTPCWLTTDDTQSDAPTSLT